MATIRVVLNVKLLRATDRVAKRTKQSRSALIRDALREYLHKVDLEERDRRGYERKRAESTGWESEAVWPARGAPARCLPPIHPGEVLREELMKPLSLSINRIARDLRVPVTRISDIVNGRRSITADTALRLARYFGNSPQFWLNLQQAYELELAKREAGELIVRDVRPRTAA